MAQPQAASGRCTPAWPKDALRITFGVIWLIDATLKRLPGFRASYMTIVFSLLIWATAEGFGGPHTSGASDIGTAIIYAVVFAALLARSYYAGPSRYSADYYIEQKVSRWWKVAETRRPASVEAVAAGVTPAAEAATLHPQGALPR